MSARGFSLIELLVVVAIMGVVGVFTLANFRSFGEDRTLKNGLLDIQSILRVAQTNAGANVKCNTKFGATWTVEFSSSTNINLKCTEPQAATVTKKVVTLDQALQIKQITGSGSGCPDTIPLPLSIVFTPQQKTVDLGNANCSLVTITIKNNKNDTKSLNVEQGGRVYEKTN